MTAKDLEELRKSLDYFMDSFYEELNEDCPHSWSSSSFVEISERYDNLLPSTEKKEHDSNELLLFLYEATNYLCGRFRQSDSKTMGTTKLLLSSLGDSFDNGFDEMRFRLDTIEKEQKEITRNLYQIMNYLEVLYKKINEIN